MAGLFPQEFIEQVRSANDIVEVIGGYVQLKRAGSSFKGLSPFTKEKTPSFFVNPDKQVFYCFSSGQGGDVIRFLMAYEGVKFTEAVERLAERAKIPMPRLEGRSAESDASWRQKGSLLEIQEKVVEFYHSLLMRSPQAAGARDYLKGRQLGSETARSFRLGYSPTQWDGLIAWARREDVPVDKLEQLGLVIRGKGGLYDRFRDRLTIPIRDERGRTVGFTARLLSKDAKEAKYVNSPETEIFSKGKLLFGLDRAKRTLMETRRAIVCEGQIDCIMCQSHGIDNVVAPQGTALTDYQARLLKRYADEVIFCFDSDSAGKSATRRNAQALLKEGVLVKAAVLPAGGDPDSIIRQQGVDALRRQLDGAKNVFEWEIDQWREESDPGDPASRARVAKNLAELWLVIPDEVLKESLLQRMAVLLDISERALETEFTKKEASLPRITPARPAAVSRRGSAIEEMLLTYCLLSETAAIYVLGHLDPEWLEEGMIRQWLLEIFHRMETEGWEAACQIRADDPEAEAKHQLKGRLLTKSAMIEKDADALKKPILRLQESHLGRKIREKHEAFRAASDPREKKRIQGELHELEKREHEIRKSLTMS